MNLLFLSLILAVNGTSGVKADNILIKIKDKNVSVVIENVDEEQVQDLLDNLLFAVKNLKKEEVPTQERG